MITGFGPRRMVEFAVAKSESLNVVSNGALAFARQLIRSWAHFSLVRRFAIISLAVIGSVMAAMGLLVSNWIQDAVVKNSANSAALYMSSLIEPIFADFSPDGRLSEEQAGKLKRLLSETALGKHIVSLKIWVNGSTVAYSNHLEQVGRVFELDGDLQEAWKGQVAGDFNQLNDPENAAEKALGLPLLEIYAPLHDASGKKIVAVGEFYEVAPQLEADLLNVHIASWIMVAGAGLAMFGALYSLVRKAGQVIDAQNLALGDRVARLTTALAHNEELTGRVDEANHRAAEHYDRFLRRIGAELHDGPAQLLALTLLRLDGLAPLQEAARMVGKAEASVQLELDSLRRFVGDSLKEIRNISSGLSLPEVRAMTLQQALQSCAEMHENRTGCCVERELSDTPIEVSVTIKTCLYRFAQEGLNNAFKHSGTVRQRLRLTVTGTAAEVEVADEGTGFEMNNIGALRDRIGIAGMRDRIISLGGSFHVCSKPGTGTRLTARFERMTGNHTVGDHEYE